MMAKKKSKQSKRNPVLVLLLVLLTMFSLLGLSFRLLLIPPITRILAENTVNSSLSDFKHSELVEVAEMGRAYVAGDKGATLPEGTNEKTAYPPDVISHMDDVRYVIHMALIATIALVVLLIISLIIAGIKAGRRTISFGLLFGGIMAVVLALVLATIGFVNFDRLFTAMHELFFAEGTWTFAVDSLLICTYPIEFWIGMGIVWAILLMLLSSIVSFIGYLFGRGTTRIPRQGSNTRSELVNVG